MAADGPRVILLSGEIGSGKTTACARLVELARAQGLPVAGVLSPPKLQDAERVGIWVENIISHERRLLAVVEPDVARRTVGPYRFHVDVVAWANACLLGALAMPGTLVIVDEIGPLELDRGGGFAPALIAISGAHCRAIVLVVRRALTARLAERLAIEPEDPTGLPSLVGSISAIIRLDDASRDALPARILALCADRR